MDHRLDTRLLQLAPPSLHGLSLELCAIDEFKGWWCREAHLGSAAEDARRTVSESLDALAKVEAFGAPEARAQSRRVARGSLSAPAAGYADTLEAVLCNHGRMEFGEELLLELHGRLLVSSPAGRKGAGQYRSPCDRAVATERGSAAARLAPMAAHLVPGETRALIEWTRSRLSGAAFHPLLTISSLLLELLAIRPFEHGNARLARVIGHLLLLRCGYDQVARVSLDAVVADRWEPCQIALHKSLASRRLPRPDIAPWLGACLGVLLEHARRVRVFAEQSPDESLLSANQLGVLRLLDRNREITNRAIREGLGLPRDTAKQVIKRLVALGRVEVFGAGRAVRYRRTVRRRDSGGPTR